VSEPSLQEKPDIATNHFCSSESPYFFLEKEIFMCTYGLWRSCTLNNKALQGFVLFVSFTWTFDSLLFFLGPLAWVLMRLLQFATGTPYVVALPGLLAHKTQKAVEEA